jgi:hypothetical protein
MKRKLQVQFPLPRCLLLTTAQSASAQLGICFFPLAKLVGNSYTVIFGSILSAFLNLFYRTVGS